VIQWQCQKLVKELMKLIAISFYVINEVLELWSLFWLHPTSCVTPSDIGRVNTARYNAAILSLGFHDIGIIAPTGVHNSS
jgi:hypothetical protein